MVIYVTAVKQTYPNGQDRLSKCAFNANYETVRVICVRTFNTLCHDLPITIKKFVINMSNANDRMHDYYSNIWSRDIHQIPKLKTYVLFMQSFETENYVQLNLCKMKHSILSQFRTGLLPLCIKTGRYI